MSGRRSSACAAAAEWKVRTTPSSSGRPEASSEKCISDMPPTAGLRGGGAARSYGDRGKRG